jgi:8-oxo-dGTP pyrophosphatase MutT (NUDIX family)
MEKAKFYRTYNQHGTFIRNLPAGQLRTGLSPSEYLAAVQVIVSQGEDIIITKRGENEASAGLLDIISGKIDNNEKPKYAGAREVYEELRVPANIGKLTRLSSPFEIQVKHEYNSNWITNFFHKTVPPNFQITPDNDEVAELIYVPKIKLMKFIKSNRDAFMFGDPNTDLMFQHVVDILTAQR